MRVPALETERLVIRPFVIDDLDAIHQLLDIELAEAEFGTEGATSRDERAQWLRWTMLSYEELAKLNQPPYGDRAIVLKRTQEIIGACGYVQSFGPFGQLPSFSSSGENASKHLKLPEFGLFYALSPAHQRQGYATEATKALIQYAFTQLGLKRIIATTTYDNEASMSVMRKVGMRIEKNPYSEPPWFQVVGILENSTASQSLYEIAERQYHEGEITHVPTQQPLTDEECKAREQRAKHFADGKSASDMVIEDRGPY